MVTFSAAAACGPSPREDGPATDGAPDASLVCEPNAGTCDGEISHACLPDGSGFVDVDCDPVQGMACSPATGLCEGACAPQALGKSYVGCDFYPTVTANPVDDNFHFAVALANTTADYAQITVEGGGLAAPQTFTLAPLAVEVVPLPWVDALKAASCHDTDLGCGYLTTRAALSTHGAYRVRSTRPLTAYQFNPLEFEIGSQRSYSNDASLLAPVTAMTGRYAVVGWPAWDTGGVWQGASPGFVAITATADHTAVVLTTTADTPADGGAPAFASGVPQTVMLDRGDVLQVTADAGDLTGSRVIADRAVQVIAGHYCTQVPFGVSACDHLEETMFPLETLGADYLVTAPAVPALPDGKPHVVRIVGTEPATTLTFDPPRDAPTTIEAGGVVELDAVTESFRVSANKRIVVAQYMEGYNAGGLAGDPSMSLAVATAQFRTAYRFHVPASYVTSYANVIAPAGSVVELDGTALVGFSPIGGSGFGVVRLELAAGSHAITSTAAVGVSVYGYAPTTSYWYPGGLDLAPLVIE